MRKFSNVSRNSARSLRLKYMDLMQPLAQKGKLKNVEKLFHKFEEDGQAEKPDIYMYNLLLHACAQARDLSAAQRYLNEMLEHSIEPDEISFRTIMMASSSLSDAESWFKEMKSESIQPTVRTFNSLLAIILRESRQKTNKTQCNESGSSLSAFTQAENILQRMGEQSIVPNVVTHNTILKIALDDSTVTEKMLQELFASISNPDKISYSVLIEGTSSPFEQEKILQKMHDDGIEIDPALSSRVLLNYNHLSTPPFEENETICSPGALELFAKYEEWGIQITTMTYGAMLNPLSYHWSKIPYKRRLQEIQYWAKKMQEKGLEPNEQIKHEFMKILQDDQNAVQAIFSGISNPLLKSYQLLAQIYVHNDDIDSVTALLMNKMDFQIGLSVLQALSRPVDDEVLRKERASRAEDIFHILLQHNCWMSDARSEKILQEALGQRKQQPEPVVAPEK